METKIQVKLAFRKYKPNVYPMPEKKFLLRALSKKLYERCIKNHEFEIRSYHGHICAINHDIPNFDELFCTYVQFGKYTIVELVCDGKHYHGVAALAPCDEMMTSAGIAVAYHRAFDSMMEDTR